LLQDRAAFEACIRILENDLCHLLIERHAQQHATLARDQSIGVIAQSRDVGGEHGHGARFSAPPPYHCNEFIDPLQWFALAAGKSGECFSLVVKQRFAHRGYQ
jgi:hypothetical protein